MTPYQRLMKTVKKEPVDRPPLICPGGMMTMAVKDVMQLLNVYWPSAHEDPCLMAQLTRGMADLAGIENLGVPFCMTVEAEGMGAGVDLGHQTREPHVIRYPMKNMADMDRLSPLDTGIGRAAVCCDAIRILKQAETDLPILANLPGPASLATSLVDPMRYYRSVHRDKKAIHELTRFCTDQVIRFGDAMIDAGAEIICIADPSATGDLLGPTAFSEFVLPYLNRMTRHFQEVKNVPVIVHICGKIKKTGTLIKEMDAQVISVDSVVGITSLHGLAPDKVTMGNISTYTLELGTPEKVEKAGRSCLRNGVDILAPACGISPLTPLANLKCLSNLVATFNTSPDTKEKNI
ncbi:MtaA/CmuA family methyltransferase [Desulfobacula sp.]|uniref:MtaA/CmuA family methyltransferase n=1 Tax=Desulfobacula sp. TaxID=2593537 RepID=UPI0026233A9A|nr:MtaA/CmuA family methyltransferase [Desulfobacula sp.]